MRHQYLYIFLFIAYSFLLKDQASAQTGSISGKVVDTDTQAPLAGANIVIMNSNRGAATDTAGNFTIHQVPIGNYSLEFSYMGYEILMKPDVIVRPDRFTLLETELNPAMMESEEVVVHGTYFQESADQPASTVNFSSEEIRRAPGSAGDVSRILMSLPSVAKINDQSNSLIVRGGSPIENAFYVDNIEIPNINHFPTQGASGGPIGLLQVDFIKDVNFSSGGYSAIYGDKLSSIMEINFREGNRNEFDGQLDLNFAGFGGMFEGPLFNKTGSWMVALRRSYLDLLLHTIDMGTTASPSYGDFQGKLVFDLNPNHRLSTLVIMGDDHNDPTADQARQNDMVYFGNQDIYENTAGLTWRALWDKNGYSSTSLAYTGIQFRENYFETGNEKLLLKNRSLEQTFKFRNLNHFVLNPENKFEFGLEAQYLDNRYDNYYASYTDAIGLTTSDLQVNQKQVSTRFGLFMNYIFQAWPKLTLTLGGRIDYDFYRKYTHYSPRLAVTYQLNRYTSFHTAAGIYYQNIPTLLLVQNPETSRLADPRAVHFILGMNRLLNENTRLTLEIYQKKYSGFPIDHEQPSLFLIDEIFYRYGFFLSHNHMDDSGLAWSRGIEITIQKKLAREFYGLASISYSRATYRGGDGIWYDRVFDNRILVSMEGGYKPNSRWEFSLRWIYAGGSPFTPIDPEASRKLQRAVLDEHRINAIRYPDYHSMNIRVDRRFQYFNSNLVFYISLWNAYNQKNIAAYFWNASKNQEGIIYQWSLLPIFGLEYEF